MSVYTYPLLIEKHRDNLLRAIGKNNTTIVKGPTGCGKSTFIPLLFKENRVAIVEPRRIAVTSLYNTLLPHIPGLGYKMRFDKKIRENTNVVIFTDGSFLNEIHSLDYDYIIIDEVHERSIRTDLILGVLRTNYKNKLILMSASIDTGKLEKYFNARTYEIPGRSNPVEIRFLEKPTSDYIVESYLVVKKILKTREKGEKKDILIFLPGEEDINDLYHLCSRIPSVAIYKIYSSMGDKAQQRIYEENNLTRVILSTNICETSLTIPNVKYVVDTGLCKSKVFDGINYLGIQSINRDSAVQRTGRCNRLGPGVCYRLYTEFELLPGYVPEILRSDLCTVILHLINLKKNILKFEFLDFPPIKNCIAAMVFLLEKGCIECFYKNTKVVGFDSIADLEETSLDWSIIARNVSFRATNYGRKVIFHPFDIHLSHFYEQCIVNKIGYYGSLLLSLISQENCSFMNAQAKNTPDVLYLVGLLEKYMECGDKKKYCTKHNIPLKGMEIACNMFKTLNKSRDGDSQLVERVFSAAFSHNLCIREKDGSFTLKRNGLQIFIHPSSAFFKRNDRKIVVVDIFYTTKTYARIVGKYYE